MRPLDPTNPEGTWQYGEYTQMYEEWGDQRPVVEIGKDADGHPVGRYLDDISDDPLIFTARDADPFDPETFLPVNLSEYKGVITDTEPVVYPTVIAWREARIPT